MEIRNLITFIKVAEEQSLSKAAKQLGYAQSTVTMQMQQLEQELGILLYERVGRQIRITQEGQELLTYAAQIVRTSQEALQIGKKKHPKITGELRLGVMTGLEEEQLAEKLHRYTTAFPDVRIRAQSADSQTLTQQLLHNEIDLMMILDNRVTDPVFVHACDIRERVHFVAAAEHPLSEYGLPDSNSTKDKRKKRLTLADLLQYRLIRGDLATAYERMLERTMAQMGYQSHDCMEINNQNLAIKMVLNQNGITLVPDNVVRQYLQDKRLIRLDCELPECDLWQQTLYHKNKWITGAMNAWINMLGDIS